MRTVLLIDLDGTLTDPREGIVGCFRNALAAMKRPQPASADLTWIIGPPLRRSFAALLGGPADVEAALGLYRACYGSEGLFQATVYDGVREALTELQAMGVRLFLCTSKPLVYAERILKRFDLARCFEACFGAELDGRLEDKGDLIAHILADRRLEPETCALLGDRENDVFGALRHGIPTLGALWGFGGEAELRAAGAAELCASPGDVPAMFRRLPAGAMECETSVPLQPASS
jgi:phosphoglycolate phosphatase